MLFSNLQELVPYTFSSDREIANALKELSEGFTTRRDKIGKYVLSDKLISAYALYYFPTNAQKFNALISHLPSDLVEQITRRPFIDFGCGPGTYSYAFSQLSTHGSVKLVESSSKMLSLARKVLNCTDISFSSHKDICEIDDANSTLFFGNSFNELSYDLQKSILERTSADCIIFIEPGTKASFHSIISFHDLLMSRGYIVNYPCRGAESICPMIGTDDWCHQIVNSDLSVELQRLSQMAAIDRRRMPVVMRVYSKHSHNQNGSLIFQELGVNKHSLRYKICNESRVIKIIEEKISHLKKKEVKSLKLKRNQGQILD